MKKALFKLLIIIGATAMISSCSPKIQDYANAKPALNIKEYLNGELEVHGLLKNRSGKVIRQFNASVVGSWEGNKGKLVEHFVFNDGEEQDRTWIIEFTDDHNFTATAGDVIGNAKGSQYGNAVNMVYTLRTPYKDSTIDVKINDWIFLLDSKYAINTSILTKFGFKVGELVIFFNKK